jgi:hypothetical protein
MVRVKFERSRHDTHQVGPAPWVRLSAASLFIGPDNRPAAHYHGGVWTVEGGASTTRFHIDGGRCVVHFGGDDTPWAIHGPFDKVEVVDGALYTYPDRHLLARLDEGNRLWFTYEDRRYWPVLVIEDGNEHGGSPTSEPGYTATVCREPHGPPA